MCYQIISLQYKIYIIQHETPCPSASYHERIVSKQKLLATAEKINPKDPLINDFIDPIIRLLSDWTKDIAVCPACKGQILEQDEFSHILVVLHNFIQRTTSGKTITKDSIKFISNGILTAINNVITKSFCTNFKTF